MTHAVVAVGFGWVRDVLDCDNYLRKGGGEITLRKVPGHRAIISQRINTGMINPSN